LQNIASLGILFLLSVVVRLLFKQYDIELFLIDDNLYYACSSTTITLGSLLRKFLGTFTMPNWSYFKFSLPTFKFNCLLEFFNTSHSDKLNKIKKFLSFIDSNLKK